jgi:tRNA dimethylallyltransferase
VLIKVRARRGRPGIPRIHEKIIVFDVLHAIAFYSRLTFRQSGVNLAETPSIFAIIGPTASGKSALALALARQLDADILCVDSMTIYRHMNIGTAKPTAVEQAGVRHHLIDVIDPDQEFTAARFVAQADEVIAAAKSSGRRVVAVGGTPMYFKTLFEGLFEGPGADPELRAALQATPPEQLYEQLRQVDPEAAARFHMNDSRRLIRAMEVFHLTGKPISAHQREWGGTHRHAATWIGLHWEREEINRRINARTKQMIADGWVEETRSLLNRFQLSKTASEAAGYAELIDHLRGRQSLEDAIEQIKIATRQLARRQMKWFRRFENVRWLNGATPAEEHARHIMSSMNA